jgi:hypothetical protein
MTRKQLFNPYYFVIKNLLLPGDDVFYKVPPSDSICIGRILERRRSCSSKKVYK